MERSDDSCVNFGLHQMQCGVEEDDRILRAFRVCTANLPLPPCSTLTNDTCHHACLNIDVGLVSEDCDKV